MARWVRMRSTMTLSGAYLSSSVTASHLPAKQLKKVFDQTNTSYDEKALELIAKAGNGSVRDTLSVAEMCKAFSGGEIKYSSVEECLGLTDNQTLFNLATSIVKKDGGEIIKIVDNLYNLGKNMNTLLSDVCEFFNNVLTVKIANGYNLNVPQNILDNYISVADICETKYLVDIVKSLAESIAQIKFCFNEKVFAETVLLSLFYNNNFELENVKNRISALESGQTINTEDYSSKKKLNLEYNVTTENIDLKDMIASDVALKQSKATAKTIFGKLIGYIRQSGEMMLYAGLQDVLDVNIKDDIFIFECKTQDIVTMLLEQKDLLIRFLKEHHNINNIQASIFIDKDAQNLQNLKELLDEKLEIID